MIQKSFRQGQIKETDDSMRAKNICFLVSIACSLHAVHYEKVDPDVSPPWFTGSLLSNSATTVPLGHIDVEPYFFFTDTYGSYNNHWKSVSQPDFWGLNFQVPFWIGLSSWADLVIVPSVTWNHTLNQSHWVFNDFQAGLEFQLYRSEYLHKSWIPSIKVALQQTFPTGKYDQLSSGKDLTDQGGFGAYVSTLRLMIGRMENIYDDHFFKWLINFNYALPTTVLVNGLNAYGGGSRTEGTVHPGRNIDVDLAFEYNLSRSWALALDLEGTWQTRSHFHGRYTNGANGHPIPNVTPSWIQYSIAPAIEYNFSANLGIIGGVWVTLAGKNSGQFCSGVIALNYFR